MAQLENIVSINKCNNGNVIINATEKHDSSNKNIGTKQIGTLVSICVEFNKGNWNVNYGTCVFSLDINLIYEPNKLVQELNWKIRDCILSRIIP